MALGYYALSIADIEANPRNDNLRNPLRTLRSYYLENGMLQNYSLQSLDTCESFRYVKQSSASAAYVRERAFLVFSNVADPNPHGLENA
jgi:hypothetical protein